MIKREDLLKNYIRPFIYSLIKVCSDESHDLVHIWEQQIEKNFRIKTHYEGELFGLAYVYLLGFKDRNEKNRLDKKDIIKEYEQFFYLFEIALKEFPFFKDEIFYILKKAITKINRKIKISDISNKYKNLVKKYDYVEKTKPDKPKPIIKTISTPIEEEIGEGRILSGNEIRELTKIWIGKTSEIPTESVDIEKGIKEPKHKPIHITPKVKRNKIWIILIVLLILAGIYYYNYYLDYVRSLGPVLIENTTIMIQEKNESAPVNIRFSFEDIIKNYEDYDNIEMTLTGYLHREIESVGSGGVYVESVVDDFGNKIKLLNLDKEQIKLFLKTGTTEDTYNVSGVFKRNYNSIDLEVRTIIKVSPILSKEAKT